MKDPLLDKWCLISAQLFRALRGSRSQVAFSRRLGYQSNPVSNWEKARRFPVASVALQVCAKTGIDVERALKDFLPTADAPSRPFTDEKVRVWLDTLRGSSTVRDLAARMNRSRDTVGAWLSGRSRPRLPDFLRLVEAITGRAADLVAYLVPAEQIPAVEQIQQNRAAAKAIAFDEPWSAAILRLMETDSYRRQEQHTDGWAAQCLGIPLETEKRALDKMLATGVIHRDGKHFSSGAGLTIDATSDSEAFLDFKDHWMQAMRVRARARRESDLFSFNLMSMSNADYQRARQILVAAFREIRSVVAASKPTETVALVQLQLMEWSPSDGETVPTGSK